MLSLVSQNSPNSHPRNIKTHPTNNNSLLCTCSEITHLSLLSTDHPPLITHHVPSAEDTQKCKATFIFQSDSYTPIYILFHFPTKNTHTLSLTHKLKSKKEKRQTRAFSLSEGNYDGSEGSVFCRISLHFGRRRWGSISGHFSQLYSQHAFSTDSV